MCMQGAQQRGSAAYQARASPSKACGFTLPHNRMAAGVHQSHMQNKGPKLPLVYICPLHNPLWGATTAGTTTKCQSKLLNNKSTEKKHISVTHVTVCRPPRAPSCAPTLPRSTSYLRCCHVAPPVYKVLSSPSLNLV